MKAELRIISSILMVLICGANLFAQITITEQSLAGFGSLVNLKFSLFQISVEEGQSGANQDWDVAGYNCEGNLIRRTINPAATEFSQTFPSATRCERDSFENGTYTDSYFQSHDEQLLLLGNVTITLGHEDPGVVEFNPIAFVMPLPVTFGSPSWTSVSEFGYELFPGTNYSRRDSSIYVVDGWGSVETDNGTYQVLRVFGQSWATSTITGTPPVTSTSTNYLWVDMHGNTICSMSSEGLNPDIDEAKIYIADALQFVDVNDETPVVITFSLSQNYPNPFNSSTQIQYSLPITSAVQMRVFDVLGREVVTLLNGDLQAAGSHLVNWNGRNAAGVGVATGMYVVRMEAGEFRDEVKMMLVK